MANRYWVGNGGNWSDDDNHWATSSGGTPANGNVPTSADNAIFDANSFSSASQTVTVDVESNCKNLDFTNATNSPTLQYNASLNVYGNFTLIAAMTISGTFYQRFKATSGTQQVTTAGNTIPCNIDINAPGATILLMDNYTQIQSGFFQVQYTAGTFDTGGYTFSPNRFLMEGTGTRVFNANASAINLSGGWICTGSNITLNMGTSTITMGTGGWDSGTFTGGSNTYYNVTFNRSGLTNVINGSNIYNILNFAGTGGTLQLTASKVQTVTSFVAEGTASDLKYITSTSGGSASFIVKTSGTVNVNYLSIQDIQVSGGATFNAYNSTDVSGNSGWNFLVPSTLYWIGGTGSWNDSSHWSESSGGTAHGYFIPTSTAAIVFDANSFSANGQILTINSISRCKSLTFADIDQDIEINHASDLIVGGSITLSNHITTWNTGAWLYIDNPDNDCVFTQNGATMGAELSFNTDHKITLGSDVSLDPTGGGYFEVHGYTGDYVLGEFDSAGYNISCVDFELYSLGTVTLGDTIVTLIDSAAQGYSFIYYDSSIPSFSGASSSIVQSSQQGVTNCDIDVEDQEILLLDLQQSATIDWSATYNTINLYQGKSYKLWAEKVIVITNALNAIGSSGNLITITKAGGTLISDGNELITNGTFTGNANGWNVGNGWAYSSNALVFTAPGSGSRSAYQTITLVNGQIYFIDITVTGTVGTIGIGFGDTNGIRTYSIYNAGIGAINDLQIPADGVSDRFMVVASSDFDGTIDSVSVQKAIYDPSEHGILSKTSGQVFCDYLDLTDCKAQGGAEFYAGSHSVDSGNNEGWRFYDRIPKSPILMGIK